MRDRTTRLPVQRLTIPSELSGPIQRRSVSFGSSIRRIAMGKLLQLTYAAVAYVLFLGAFLYAIGFVGDLMVPKTIDSGPQGPWILALAIDAALLGVFAIQHS